MNNHKDYCENNPKMWISDQWRQMTWVKRHRSPARKSYRIICLEPGITDEAIHTLQGWDDFNFAVEQMLRLQEKNPDATFIIYDQVWNRVLDMTSVIQIYNPEKMSEEVTNITNW